MACQRGSHKAGRLHLFDKRIEVAGAGLAPLGQTHGLLDHHESTLQQAQTGKALGIGLQLLLDAGCDLNTLRQKQVGHSWRGRCLDQAGRLDFAA